jgi:hypothetical protein
VTVRAHCEDCEDPEGVIITPTGKKQREGWSAEWWRMVEHKDKKTGQWCPGSGRLV